MGKYSIDKMHTIKIGRQSGKSVDAVVDAIGKLMVTEYDVIPFIIKRLDRSYNLRKIFIDLCINHFNVKPICKQLIFGIEGYTSKIKFYSIGSKEVLGYDIEPTFDLD
jgi:hypothetical protein